MPLKLKRDVRMHGVYYTHMAKHNRSTQKRPCCSIPIMRHSRKTETQAFYRSVALEVSAGTGIEHRCLKTMKISCVILQGALHHYTWAET